MITKVYPKYAEAYYNKANLLKFYNKNKRAKKAILLRLIHYNNLNIFLCKFGIYFDNHSKNVTIKKADPSLQSYILELLESKDIVRPIKFLSNY